MGPALHATGPGSNRDLFSYVLQAPCKIQKRSPTPGRRLSPPPMQTPFSLRERRLEPERMDQPGLEPAEHRLALRGLARINAWSGTTVFLARALARLAREQGRRELRVLDIATGGGDTPLRLWQWGQRHGLDFRVDGCDRSATAVEEARRKAEAFGSPARFFALNVFRDPLPPDYDVILSCLFLHHLAPDSAIELIRRMASAAGYAVLLDDLQRRPAGMALAWLGTRVLSRSRVVHEDGLRSVAAAFTMDEAADLAVFAGLDGFEIRPHWPFRYLLSWRRSEPVARA